MKKKIICLLISIVVIICVFLIAMECKYSNGRISENIDCTPGSSVMSAFGIGGEEYDVTATLTGEISRGKFEIYVLDGKFTRDNYKEEDIIEKIIIEEIGKFEKIISIGDVSTDNIKSLLIVCTDDMNQEGSIGTCKKETTSNIKGWDKFFSDNDLSGLSSIGE